MDSPVKLTPEKWLEEVHALKKEKGIYMKFEFPHGRIRAKLSSPQVSGKTILVLRHQSTLADPGAIELQTSLPEPGLADCEKRIGEANTACLSILYKVQTRGNLTSIGKLYLSNSGDLLNGADSESLSPSI